MKELEKVRDAINKLNFILTKEQKKYTIIIFFMSLIAALLEMLGLSILMPLMQAFWMQMNYITNHILNHLQIY